MTPENATGRRWRKFRRWSRRRREPGRAIAFAIDTGLRKEEQFSLLVSDIDFGAKQLRVRKEVAKNRKARMVPLLDRALAIALRLSEGRIGTVPLFVTQAGNRYSRESPTMYEALQKACKPCRD